MRACTFCTSGSKYFIAVRSYFIVYLKKVYAAKFKFEIERRVNALKAAATMQHILVEAIYYIGLNFKRKRYYH